VETVGALPRTHIIRLEENGGPATARNVGLATILSKNYDFVALLDSDDVAHSERIATQVAFLDQHPEFGAVGGWTRVTDETNGEVLYIARTPDDPDVFRRTLYYNAAIVNSTLMIRTMCCAPSVFIPRAIRWRRITNCCAASPSNTP
jgi:glycosyltransferase involved in cell wall biosynthesis